MIVIPLTLQACLAIQDSLEKSEKHLGMTCRESYPFLREIADTTRIFLGPLIGTRWGAYLGVDDVTRQVVGTCSFKGAPNILDEVEIAYYTFPPFEGKGYATLMAKQLVEIALGAPEVNRVVAHTLAAENSSTKILKRLGFSFEREATDPDDGQIWKWSLGR